jgi:hypothetical protein
VIQLFGLKPNLQTTHASKLGSYRNTFNLGGARSASEFSVVKFTYRPKERPTNNTYLRAWEVVMILENRWVSLHSTQPTNHSWLKPTPTTILNLCVAKRLCDLCGEILFLAFFALKDDLQTMHIYVLGMW